jgi:hypothetical protein
MTDEQKGGTAFDAIDGSCTCGRLWASTNKQTDNYSIFKKEEETMTEKSGNDVGVTKTEAPDMTDWSQITFTCPECHSNRLLKCLGDVRGQVHHAEVVEIHYKRAEWEDSDEDDVEDTEVLVQLRPDLIETWDLSGDDESFFYFWFRCAECDYQLVDEDGRQPGDDVALAQWLIRHRMEPSESGNTFENRS